VSESLLCLNADPGLEPDLIDWLLGRSDIGGFTSMACFGHGQQHVLESIAEHVSGKARRVQFLVLLEDGVQASLLGDLDGEFSGADIIYWVLPVAYSGNLSGL
jgi:hypothetical protein